MTGLKKMFKFTQIHMSDRDAALVGVTYVAR